MEDQKLFIPRPEPHVFRSDFRSHQELVSNQRQVLNVISRVVYPDAGGIYIEYEQVPFAKKGFPFPEAVSSCNVVKRLTMGLLSGLSMRQMLIPIVGYMILPWKSKISIIENFLEGYIRATDWILEPYYLKDTRYSFPVQQVDKVLTYFLWRLGINWELARKTSLIFSTLIEYDNAYRWRIQDIAGEVNLEDIKDNPRKEIKRVVQIYLEREKIGIFHKFTAIAKIFNFLLYLPKVKRAFKESLSYIDMSKIVPDESDKYFTLTRKDYDFGGKDFDTRMALYMKIHESGLPPCLIIEPQ